MTNVKATFTRIDQSFKSVLADMEALEKDLKHFHRKDERKRFDDLKAGVKELRRLVRELTEACSPCID